MRHLALIVLLAALTALCCAPRALTPTVSGASVVTLVEPFEPLDEDGAEPLPPRWGRYCDAFAVPAPLVPGHVLLLTADHCVRRVDGIQRYLSPDGVGHGRAIAWSSWGQVAALLPLDPVQLRPLELAHAPPVGSHVEAVSSLYETSARGVVVAELGSGVVETSLAVRRGWSGSPVLDEDGAAWGVVVGCQARPVSALDGDLECTGATSTVAVIR
jgi:hypothetical protein